MRVLVCGGRNFKDREYLYKVLDNIHQDSTISSIIEGDANGADKMAGDWARENNVENLKFSADWKKFGYSAGPIRNRRMLTEGKPTFVLAFEGGKGTANMLKQAENEGIRTTQCTN